MFPVLAFYKCERIYFFFGGEEKLSDPFATADVCEKPKGTILKLLQLFYSNPHTIDTPNNGIKSSAPLPLLINSAEPPVAQLDTASKFKGNYQEKTHPMSIVLTNVI